METPLVPKSLTTRLQEGLERIGTALRADDWAAAGAEGINPAQFAILASLEGRPDGLRVGEIAAQLGIAQPSATESIGALERKGLVLRSASPGDRRSVQLRLTTAGSAVLGATRSRRRVGASAIGTLTPPQQQDLLVALVTMIRQMQEAGAIPIQRMCVSCRYFRPNAHAGADHPHHCSFVDAAFGDAELRVDCREHEVADPASRAATWEAFAKDHHVSPGP